MKTLLIAGLLATAPLIAGAQVENVEAYGLSDSSFESLASRADVAAQARASRSNGEMAFGEFAMPDVAAQAESSELTRDTVRQEVLSLNRTDDLPRGGEF